jgi:hypothetical protein
MFPRRWGCFQDLADESHAFWKMRGAMLHGSSRYRALTHHHKRRPVGRMCLARLTLVDHCLHGAAQGFGETEKEALANAQKELAKTEAERKRIHLRAQ